MKHLPKIIFGIFILLSILALTKNQSAVSSQATLTSSENIFSLKFNLTQKDKNNFSQFLENIKADSLLTEGVEFELDATSTAALSIALPIKSDLSIKPDKLSINGEIENIDLQLFSQQPIYAPQSTNLTISSSSLKALIDQKLNLPQPITKWLEDNSNSPQQILFFDSIPKWAYRYKLTDIDLSQLKGISESLGIEDGYKKEEFENLEIHLVKLSDIEERTIAIFQLEDYLYTTSSRTAAEEIINSHIHKQNLLTGTEEESSFYLSYQNKHSFPVSENLLELFFEDNNDLISSLKQIKNAEFSLKTRSFSGLINIK